MKMTMSMLLLLNFLLLLKPCLSTTILVDGVSVPEENPIVHVGDSIIFKEKNGDNLYIFKNIEAFHLCNFTQATLLTKPNSTSYQWKTSRPGVYYFSFNKGSFRNCEGSKKVTIEVVFKATPSPTGAPAPDDSGAGGRAPAPSFPWPFEPRQRSYNVTVPDKVSGIPFINSNPAVPLPTGEVDSVTITALPFSSSSNFAGRQQVTVGLVAAQMALCHVIFLFLCSYH